MNSFVVEKKETLVIIIDNSFVQVQGPLTTDGVHDHVAPQFLLSTPQSGQGLPETADILISNAIEAGSKDDMSVVLARILGRIDCGRSIFEHTH